MKCAHCQTGFHDNRETTNMGEDEAGHWYFDRRICPECKRFIFSFRHASSKNYNEEWCDYRSIMAVPRGYSRSPIPKDVPTEFAEDYAESCAVLADSPKASAALSRRCLQHILREKAGVKKGNLADEIQQILDSGSLPSHLAESLDAIRNIGNFAAHPIKSTASGEVIDVELGEAEWNLDVLEAMFDYFFVQPAILKRKRDALNAKLKEAGKPEMK